MGLHRLNDDAQRLVLLRLDLDALCAVRCAAKALGMHISDAEFRKAWVAWQKTLADTKQRRLVRCLREQGVLSASDASAAAAVLAALRMVTIAHADAPLHYCRHLRRSDQNKDCWCAMVGFEFGDWIPLEHTCKGRVAVASWTTAKYEHDVSFVSNAAHDTASTEPPSRHSRVES